MWRTYGNRHRAESHEVEGLTHQPHDEDGDRQRHRDDAGADGGDADMAQKQQQHHDRERRPDQHGVSHRTHRSSHQPGLVVHRLEPDPGGEGGSERTRQVGYAVGDAQGVGPELASDVDQRGGATVAGNDAHPVLSPGSHVGEVPHPNAPPNHDAGDVVD
jgi:hypothetical protein